VVLGSAIGLVLLVGAACTLLPFSVVLLAYRVVEHKHRASWAPVVRRSKIRLGHGPYRAAELDPGSHPVRAPWLVRAASVGCLYWGWFCTLAWVAVFGALAGVAEGELLAVVGVAVALATGRAGVRLIRRDVDAPRTARRVAASSFALAVLVLAAAVAAAASPADVDALDWLGPASIFSFVTMLIVVLLMSAARRHEADFPSNDVQRQPGSLDGLPGWLARVLSRRKLQRENFLASASHTIPGA
jgi:hypothetical protein